VIARPRLLVVSHVPPLPRNCGQRQRVYHMLRAARELFHVTFAHCAAPEELPGAMERIAPLCDETVILPSRYRGSRGYRAFHRVAGSVEAFRRGLKLSNYVIGRLEFAPGRVETFLRGRRFDLALFEYWHAADAAALLESRGIPCVLDMHDILWRALAASPGWRPMRDRQVRLYRREEEAAWRLFSGVVAINRAEEEYVRARVPERTRVFLAPMGIDLRSWPCSPAPARRVAFYGGLSSPENRAAAGRFAREVMPRVWSMSPDVEAFVVGGGAPERWSGLGDDPRIRATGFVEEVAPLLRTMAAVVCPWEGTYGFRSRLIESMALGVPVVVSPDAIHGMDLEEGAGVLVGARAGLLASHVHRLLHEPRFAAEQSRAARAQVEARFRFDATYGRLFHDLARWLPEARGVPA